MAQSFQTAEFLNTPCFSAFECHLIFKIRYVQNKRFFFSLMNHFARILVCTHVYVTTNGLRSCSKKNPLRILWLIMKENQHRSKVIIWGNPDQLCVSSQIQYKETAMFLPDLTLLLFGARQIHTVTGVRTVHCPEQRRDGIWVSFTETVATLK